MTTEAKLYNGKVYPFPLSQANETEILADFKGLCITMALKLTRDETNIQVRDLAQEGWVAMWKATKSWDGRGTLDGHMKQHAWWAMLKIVSRRKEAPASVDMTDVETWDVFADLSNSEALEHVHNAYHSGDILEAIRNLTPKQREYVIRRFWKGQSYTEIKEAMGGQNPAALWSKKFYGARDRLARQLAHLVEV